MTLRKQGRTKADAVVDRRAVVTHAVSVGSLTQSHDENKTKSRILDEMHATARDLHKLGFIDMRRMGELDAVCKLHVPALSVHKI